jgi:hypothetical protein
VALVAPNEGLADQLDYILSADIDGVLPWLLMLWTNTDLELSQDTVYADLIEAEWDGYSRVTLGRDEWTDSVIEDDAAMSTWGSAPTMWSVNGTGAAVYGYAIITPVDSVIRYVEAFGAPWVLVPGRPVGVLPRVTLTTLAIESRVRSRSRGPGRATKPKGR